MSLTELKVQILEKIGAPLAAAIDCVAANSDEEVKSAQDIAKMLSQAVEMSIHLSQALDIKGTEEEADSVRIALAALVAPLLGDFYRQNTQVPDETSIKRLNESFEAVLAFSENFKSAQNQKSRLVTLAGENPIFDDTQTTLVTLQALVPVMNAIAEFPFGQSEKKLLQDVAQKLHDHADNMAGKALLDNEDKLSRLLIFKALAQIYTSCHRAETARLMQDNTDNAKQPSPDMVWETFALRLAMVEAVIVPGGDEGQKPIPETTQTAPETASKAAEPEQTTSSTASASPAAGGNPMGFFKSGGDTPEQDSSDVPADMPETPTDPSVAPEESKPVEPPASDTENDETTNNSSANPMGFFKPGSKPADNSDDDQEGTIV